MDHCALAQIVELAAKTYLDGDEDAGVLYSEELRKLTPDQLGRLVEVARLVWEDCAGRIPVAEQAARRLS